MVPEVTTRNLLRLAIPSAASVVLTNAYRSVDQYWLQFVSSDAQAAVGSLIFVLIGGFAFFEVSAVGAAPLIARATGAGNAEERRNILGTAFTLATVTGLGLSVLGLLFASNVSGLLGLEGAVAASCTEYLRAICWTLLPLALTPLIDHAYVAMGDTRTPMILQGLSLGLNIALTPLFVFDEVGSLPGLGLGIAGAAYASNGSRCVATVLGVWWLARRTGLRKSDLWPDLHLARIIRIGIPAGAGVFLYAAVYWVLLRTTISPLGSHVNAALGIGFSALEGFTWPVFHGVSIAIGSIVGRSLGAERPDLARRCIRLGLPMLLFCGVAASLVFYFGAVPLTGLFTEDSQVQDAATQYAMILAASQIFVALEALAEGVLVGAGDTRTVLWTSVPLNFLRVPLAWLLAFPLGWGAAGVWWAINYTTCAKALWKLWFVWRGRWETLKI